jgi:hypothetical protein
MNCFYCNKPVTKSDAVWSQEDPELGTSGQPFHPECVEKSVEDVMNIITETKWTLYVSGVKHGAREFDSHEDAKVWIAANTSEEGLVPFLWPNHGMIHAVPEDIQIVPNCLDYEYK